MKNRFERLIVMEVGVGLIKIGVICSINPFMLFKFNEAKNHRLTYISGFIY